MGALLGLKLKPAWYIAFPLLLGVPVVGFIIFARVCVSLFPSDLPKPVIISSIEREYSFDPSTILSSLTTGRQDVFQLIRERRTKRFESVTQTPAPSMQATRIPMHPPVAWAQADFEKVVEALTSYSVSQPVNDFRLHNIIFRVPCMNASTGAQWMSFDFFKVMEIDNQKRYLSTNVTVDIDTGRVTWSDEEWADVYGRDKSLDRNTIKITAEEALKVAESVGGTNFRQTVDNKCGIGGYMLAEHDPHNWEVAYYIQGGRIDGEFSVQVNKESGEGKIIHTPKP